MQLQRPNLIEPANAFQSSSSPRAGCNVGHGHALDFVHQGFNPHPARGPDATRACTASSSWAPSFNPHPARGPDATATSEPDRTRQRVSILIQPEGRMQRRPRPRTRFRPPGFQSSSSPRAGCNYQSGNRQESLTSTFQSSSSPRAGCNQERAGDIGRGMLVSILIQPEGRMQRLILRTDGLTKFVSILIQPEGRMQRACGSTTTAWSWRCFNPHPARGPDATRRRGTPAPGSRCSFNPHPARGPDATPPKPRRSMISSPGFNPHPARGPDATWIPMVCPTVICAGFNPHPARGPDATSVTGRGPTAPAACFNPHPARGPDATPVQSFSTYSSRTSMATLRQST